MAHAVLKKCVVRLAYLENNINLINSEIFHSATPSFIPTGEALKWMFLPILYNLAPPQKFRRNSRLKVALSVASRSDCHCLSNKHNQK